MVYSHARGRCGGSLDGKYKLRKEQSISSTGYPGTRLSFCQQHLAWVGLGHGKPYSVVLECTVTQQHHLLLECSG
jgi:hypothetical protein